MSIEDSMDKVAGKAKEGLGKVTGDKSTEYEGKTEAAKADAAKRLDDAKESASGVLDGLKNDER